MSEIIFATHNEGKLREIRRIFEGSGYTVTGMRDAGFSEEIEETGTTFSENAAIKARAVWEKTGGLVIADDSGIEIDFFDGGPGVYSSRFLGEDTPYTEKNAIILDRMKGVPEEKRGARYVAVIHAVLPDGRELETEGKVEGIIAQQPAGEGGFGYDPVFFVPELGKGFAEASMEEKNRISHRGKALEAMKAALGAL